MKTLWQKWVKAQRIGCLIVGPLFIALALIWSLYTAWFEHHSSHAQGVVTEVIQRLDDDGETVYAPGFQFTSSDGRSVNVQSQMWTSPAFHEKGDEVSVIYLPSNPANARIESFSQLWLAPLIFGMGGILSLLVGMWLQARYNQRKKGIDSQSAIA